MIDELSGWRRVSVIASLVAALAACGDSQANPSNQPGAGDARAVPVAVQVVQARDLEVTLRGTGNIQAREQVEILSKQTGVVSRIVAEEGTRVSAGQALAMLDDEELRLQLQQSEARARSSRDAADRAIALREQGLLAEEEVQRLRSEAAVAEAERDLARLRVANAVIRSPINGTVTHRWIERGQFINTTTPTFTVADIANLEVRFGVPEREAPRVAAGQPARLIVEGAAGVASGRVARIRPVVDPESGTVQVTVEVSPEDAPRLRPGRFVTVELVTETLPERIIVPRTAVLVDGARPRVFVVADGIASEREIVLGASQGDQVEIQQGIEPGDSVITVGQEGLREGANVRMVEINGQRVAATENADETQQSDTAEGAAR